MSPSPPFPRGNSPESYLVTTSNFKPKMSGQHSFLPSQYPTTYSLNSEFIHQQHTLLIMGEGRKREIKFQDNMIQKTRRCRETPILCIILPYSSVQRGKCQIPKRPGPGHQKGPQEKRGVLGGNIPKNPNIPGSYSMLTNNLLIVRAIPLPPTISSRSIQPPGYLVDLLSP